MMTGKRLAYLLTIAMVGFACTDRPQPLITDLEIPGPSADLADDVTNLQDGNNGGNADFMWLPPVVMGPVSPPGPLVPGLSPIVEICDKNGLCTLSTATEEDDHYHFGLKDGIDVKPVDGSPYAVRIFGVADYLLGSFDVALTSNRNIPIKFWIGDGFSAAEAEACVEDDRCNLGTVVDTEGGTVETTGSGLDLMGNPTTEVIAAAIFPENWSPGDIDRTVIIDCRDDLPSEFADDGSGPLNTGLTQLPWYCDFTLDPPLEPGQVFNEPVIVEVCETVNVVHGEVVLGKSSGDDFVLLPFVAPTKISENCVVDYPDEFGEFGDASGFWGGVSRRLASLFAVIGPEPLRARALRDGGAGGSAISFSLINPVIPATIEGLVLGADGFGISATVTLKKGSTTLDETTTDEDGAFVFPTSPDGELTVTVSNAGGAIFQGGPSQTVIVTETATYEVQFLPVGVFYYAETGNYYSSVSTGMNWDAARSAASEMEFGACFGQLATITSSGENDFIAENMPLATAGGYWLGAYDPQATGDFEWISGEPFSYTNWHGGEPNGQGVERWVQFFGAHGTPVDQWNDTLLNGVGAGWGLTIEFECGGEIPQ